MSVCACLVDCVCVCVSLPPFVVQLPSRAPKAAEAARKTLPFTGTTEYQDGAGAIKETEHCPVLDIYAAGIDPDYSPPKGKPVRSPVCLYVFVCVSVFVCVLCVTLPRWCVWTCSMWSARCTVSRSC